MPELESVETKEVKFIVSLTQSEVRMLDDILGDSSKGADLYSFFHEELKGGKRR